ncbi:hypothetical protein SteCoe_24667 [Stentor coeruleus]|uniref:DUF4378 domain-containing protein n=1 Tax=Stentor coeruleus TaxID=5963 RepID=A0A1R2BH39_9CILI|nr:hypothetical protein SteCoe_24667 [Stentor coeruleus]
MCSLNANTVIKQTSKSPTVLITGKKISSSIQVPATFRERSLPSRIFMKKPTQEKIQSPKKSTSNSYKHCSISVKKQCKETKSIFKKHHSLRKSFNISPPQVKIEKPIRIIRIPQTETLIKKNPSPTQTTFRPKFLQIIKSSLKKEKKKKIRKSKQKRGIAEMKEFKRQELCNQNIQIRYFNSKCKKVKLKHKYCWGVDQSRFKDPIYIKDNIKSKAKSKSPERVQTGLDIIREIQLEIGYPHIHSRALSQDHYLGNLLEIKCNNEESRINSPLNNHDKYILQKSKHQKHKKILEYMRKKDQNRKENFLNEDLYKFAEDSRIKSQLHNLEMFYKFLNKKSKGKKLKRKQGKTKRLRSSDFGPKTEANFIEDKDLNLIYETKSNKNPHENSRYYKPYRENDESNREKSAIINLPIEKNNKFTLKNSKEIDIFTLAAIKIQAHIRRFLVQRRLKRKLEFTSAIKQIKDILTRTPQNEIKSISNVLDKNLNENIQINNQLQIDISSSRQNSRSSLANNKPVINDSFIIEDNIILLQENEEKNKYQEKLKEQVIIREAQLHSLEYLKQKEIQDVKNVIEHIGQNDELSKILSMIIDKRYNQLSALFEDSMEKPEKDLIDDMGTEERKKFESELQEKCVKIAKKIKDESKNIDDLIESFVSQTETEIFIEPQPVIYKPKTQVSIISYEESDIQHCPESDSHNASIISPLPRDSTFIQESTIKNLSSDEEHPDSINMLEEFQFLTPNSSRSGKDMQRVHILSPNSNNKFLQHQFNKESPESLKKPPKAPEVQTITQKDKIKNKEIFIEESSLEISNSNPPDSLLLENFQLVSASMTPDSCMKMLQVDTNSDLFSNNSKFQFYLDSYDDNPKLMPNCNHPDGILLNPNSYEYYPERPSARLNYFDSERQSPYTNSSPGIGSTSENDLPAEESSSIEWVINIQNKITPEFIIDISENIIFQLFNEDQSIFQRPEINISNIPNVLVPNFITQNQLKTGPDEVKAYVVNIFKYSDLDEIIKNLQIPLRKNPLELLQKLQDDDIGSIIEIEWVCVPEILNIYTYLHIENLKSESYEKSTLVNLLTNKELLIIEAEHIHNKLIFDATNEALQKFRLHGLKGLPLPWSQDSHCFSRVNSLDKIIQAVTEIVYQWSKMQVGKQYNEDLFLSNQILDDELFKQVREERLANMLIDEIIEKDICWINYEYEEVQVKIDLADIILESLADETIELLGYNNKILD